MKDRLVSDYFRSYDIAENNFFTQSTSFSPTLRKAICGQCRATPSTVGIWEEQYVYSTNTNKEWQWQKCETYSDRSVSFGKGLVEIRKWTVSTIAVFQRKGGLTSVNCGLLKSFKGSLKLKNKFNSPASHVITKAYLTRLLLVKSNLVRKSLKVLSSSFR